MKHTDKSYTLTDNTKRQVNELRLLLSDGRTMNEEEIATALKRKWVKGVIHHLSDELDLLKDGRRILGYRLKNASSGARNVQADAQMIEASAAAVSRKKAAAIAEKSASVDATETVEPSQEAEIVAATSTVNVSVKRNNVVQEAPEIKFTPRTFTVDLSQPPKNDDPENPIPSFLRRT